MLHSWLNKLIDGLFDLSDIEINN